ncbi:MAG: FtsX-like permease family protein [Bacteroidota bacterium]
MRIFAAVGIFILLVACINFMNLATARSVNRSKEIGVRKVSGAAKAALIRQFFSESILLATIAMLISLLIVQTLLPGFQYTNTKNTRDRFFEPCIYSVCCFNYFDNGYRCRKLPGFLVIIIETCACFERQVHRSRWKKYSQRISCIPIQPLDSVDRLFNGCASQVKYMKDKDPRLDRDNIVYFPATRSIDHKLDAFKSEILKDPKVISISEADNNPMRVFGGMVLSDDGWPGKVKGEDIVFTWMQCDADFLSAIGP